jgi:hypothetical protein
MSGTLVDPFTEFDQRDIRNRLFQNLPPEWFPNSLEDAPNLAGVLDMLASTWTSQQVIERTLQFDVNSTILLLDGTYQIPSGSLMTGPGVLGNPTVSRTYTELIGGITYQTIVVSALQVLPAGTNLLFNVPDIEQDGIVECIDYLIAQTRLQTSTGLWLDLFSNDFFGPSLQRHINETDDSFRHRLLINVLAPRVSRCAVGCGVANLTGYQPTIIEVRDTGDCGSYTNLFNPQWGGLAYNYAGAYGSMELPFQFFIKCIRPSTGGIPDVSGYCMSGAGYATIPQPYGYIGSNFPPDTGASEYVSLAYLENNMGVTDADIYASVANSVAAGVTAWTNISSNIQSQIQATGLLDITFYLDMTCLAMSSGSPGQMRVSSTFSLEAAAEIVFGKFQSTGTIRLAANITVNNPNGFTVVSTFRLASAVSINIEFLAIASSLSIQSAASLTTENTHNVAATLSIESNATITSNITTSVVASLKPISSQVNVLSRPGVVIGPISSQAYIVNGALATDYISVDFILGTSILIPPGNLLGQTFVLATSKIGVVPFPSTIVALPTVSITTSAKSFTPQPTPLSLPAVLVTASAKTFTLQSMPVSLPAVSSTASAKSLTIRTSDGLLIILGSSNIGSDYGH